MSTGQPRASHRSRVAAIAMIVLLSPVFAEYSSGYLASAGDVVAMAGELVVLMPLYGAPALLIRELAVRRGLGWPGILLLAAAFGLVQAGITDRSIFTLTGTAEAYWPDIVRPTWVAAWGVSVGAAVSWVLGHVVVTFAAPLAVAELLIPGARGRRLLGIPALVVTALLFGLAAVAVHLEIGKTYRPVPSALQYTTVAMLAVALVALGLSPLGGRPRASARAIDRGRAGVLSLLIPLLIGAFAFYLVDLASYSWTLTAATCAAALGAAAALALLARTSWWRPASAAMAALGALLMRAIVAFQTPPATGVSTHDKTAHNVGFLALVLILVVLVGRDRRPTPHEPKP